MWLIQAQSEFSGTIAPRTTSSSCNFSCSMFGGSMDIPCQHDRECCSTWVCALKKWIEPIWLRRHNIVFVNTDSGQMPFRTASGTSFPSQPVIRKRTWYVVVVVVFVDVVVDQNTHASQEGSASEEQLTGNKPWQNKQFSSCGFLQISRQQNQKNPKSAQNAKISMQDSFVSGFACFLKIVKISTNLKHRRLFPVNKCGQMKQGCNTDDRRLFVHGQSLKCRSVLPGW